MYETCLMQVLRGYAVTFEIVAMYNTLQYQINLNPTLYISAVVAQWGKK